MMYFVAAVAVTVALAATFSINPVAGLIVVILLGWLGFHWARRAL